MVGTMSTKHKRVVIMFEENFRGNQRIKNGKIFITVTRRLGYVLKM